MFAVTVAALLVVMVIGLFRAILGPTVFDRILSVNMFGTTTVLLIAVLGFLGARPEWLDIALLYALINFIGVIAVTKYVHSSHLSFPVSDDERGDI
ncbi:MAG: monovalent cation/H+ antiporter complex subunit F [Rhodospirillales bacterium]|jgi:multicomponent Na+:H+ antiporter subunit F